MKFNFPKKNNLEWLRLIFALQVVISHTSTHLGILIPNVLKYFPGVPAFFFVSGFLIYASYLNSPGKRYFENRLLRLCPALVLVTIGGGAVALIAHGWSDLSTNGITYLVWFLSQITVFQAYNPAIFRDVGVGVINGSLWTITVELIFYITVPAIVWMERRYRFTVIFLLALSFTVYAIGPILLNNNLYRQKTAYDLLALTPIAWGWMFAFGILAVKHFDSLLPLLRYMPLVLAPMAAMILFGEGIIFGSSGNRLGLLYFLSYVGIVLWAAFSTPFLRLPVDISYGLYVWHMPIINLLLVLAIPNFWLAISLTFIISTISWFFVERPALKLKHQSLRPIKIKRAPISSEYRSSPVD